MRSFGGLRFHWVRGGCLGGPKEGASPLRPGARWAQENMEEDLSPAKLSERPLQPGGKCSGLQGTSRSCSGPVASSQGEVGRLTSRARRLLPRPRPRPPAAPTCQVTVRLLASEAKRSRLYPDSDFADLSHLLGLRASSDGPSPRRGEASFAPVYRWDH